LFIGLLAMAALLIHQGAMANAAPLPCDMVLSSYCTSPHVKINMFTLQALTTTPSTTIYDGLIELLRDSVEGGASVGFRAPLKRETADAFWQDMLREAGSSHRVMLVATTEQGEVAGSVQLALVQKENGRHRAEVQKLLVHSRYRNRGLGRRLMAAIEREAQQRGIALLVLDTIAGELAEQLYLKLGYMRVGEIPNYATFPDGRRWATVIFYKQL
jgi:acetyltransferase